MRLNAAAGFAPCPAFGDYAGMTASAIATSVVLETRIAADRAGDETGAVDEI